MPSEPPPPPHEDVPTELWIAILHHLPLASHLTLHTLNRRFRDLARPFVLSRCHLRMHRPKAEERGHTTLSTTDILDACLEFWGSEQVARLVKTVVIWDSDTAHASAERLSVIAGFIPRFHNCRKLVIRYTGYSEVLLQSLALLPRLRNLDVYATSPWPVNTIGHTPLQLHVSSFRLFSRVNGNNARDYRQWLSAINRGTLETAYLCVNPLILANISANSAFTRVTHLSIVIPFGSRILQGQLWTALTKFPATETLIISATGSGNSDMDGPISNEERAAASRMLPRLTDFRGALSMLATLLMLTCMPELRSVIVSSSCTFSKLQECILLRPQDTKLLTTLDVSIDILSRENFQVLATLLPNLRLLRVSAGALGDATGSFIEKFDQIRDFFISGTLSLPPNIQKLAIHWTFVYITDGRQSQAHPRLPALLHSESRTFRERLTSAYPMLSALWLGDHARSAMYYWRKAYKDVGYVAGPPEDESRGRVLRNAGVETEDEYWAKASSLWERLRETWSN
ncbi:hypothetical protein C8F01DRAFT_1158697 [Mycena amicta]|nr:hypothetical protein C8F01DRAFT_1158697 [Mycena amicta]